MGTRITVNKTVAYAGMISTAIKTYTLAYPFLFGGWEWSDQAMAPCEFWGFVKNGGCAGIYARIFDFKSGYTTLSFGDNTPANTSSVITNHFSYPRVSNNRLRGFCYNGTLILYPGYYDYPFTYGENRTGEFNLNGYYVVTNDKSNCFAPFSGIASNMAASGDTVLSAWSHFLDPIYVYAGSASVFNTYPAIANDFGVGNTFNLLQSTDLLADGNARVYCGDPASSTSRELYGVTQFLNTMVTYTCTFQNPPNSTFDVDAFITHTANLGTANMGGFLYFTKNTVVVEGQTLNGCGILVDLDANSYQIIKLVPQDASAANWTGLQGLVTGKMDRSGYIFMRGGGDDNKIFVTQPFPIVPVFYPQKLEDYGDTDNTLLTMRTLQK